MSLLDSAIWAKRIHSDGWREAQAEAVVRPEIAPYPF